MNPLGEAIRALKAEFPTAEVGVKDRVPYAKLADGQLYGCLFGYPKDGCWSPVAIIRFHSGQLDRRNFVLYKPLVEEWTLERE